jgi:hypothetical protein
MIKKSFSYAILSLIFFSCAAENINLSPIGSSISKEKITSSTYTLSEKKELVIHSSEITNLISTFPKFQNDAVNLEVKNLKTHLKNYIGALESYNNIGLYKANRKYEQSYPKLQKLRKLLNSNDDDVLNRYLVRIKTNMTRLQNVIPKDSVNTTLKN